VKAIIVAAGMGRRLSPVTDEAPKCLTEIGGRTILAHQLRAMREHGVDDVVIVRGYRAEDIEVPGARYYLNADYRNNNILWSLFCAEPEIGDAPFVFAYCDIVFPPSVVARLLAADADYACIVDRGWERAYDGRTLHPVSEAELTQVRDGRIVEVGKRVRAEGTVGEFIGLMKFSARGAAVLAATWRDLRGRYAGRESEPFQRAKAFRNAYLTDMLEELVARGETLTPVYIDGEWREIDTLQDLERARAWIDF
jgi:choline kinase